MFSYKLCKVPSLLMQSGQQRPDRPRTDVGFVAVGYLSTQHNFIDRQGMSEAHPKGDTVFFLSWVT